MCLLTWSDWFSVGLMLVAHISHLIVSLWQDYHQVVLWSAWCTDLHFQAPLGSQAAHYQRVSLSKVKVYHQQQLQHGYNHRVLQWRTLLVHHHRWLVCSDSRSELHSSCSHCYDPSPRVLVRARYRLLLLYRHCSLSSRRKRPGGNHCRSRRPAPSLPIAALAPTIPYNRHAYAEQISSRCDQSIVVCLDKISLSHGWL